MFVLASSPTVRSGTTVGVCLRMQLSCCKGPAHASYLSSCYIGLTQPSLARSQCAGIAAAKAAKD